MDEVDISRFPRRAQDYITRLINERNEAQALLAAERDPANMAKKNKSGRVAIRTWGGPNGLEQVNLPDDSKIKFGFSAEGTAVANDRSPFDIEVGILHQGKREAGLSGCWLQIQGMNTLEIIPGASNSIYVRVTTAYLEERVRD